MVKIGLSLLCLALLTGCVDDRRRQYNSALVHLSQGNLGASLQQLSGLAKNGYSPAQFRLGLMYLHGMGIKSNPRQAAFWFEKAAQQGDISGQYSIAKLYLNGVGVSKNPALALRWMERLAEQGYAPAQFQTGLMYANGIGSAIDNSKAVHWIQTAAQQQHNQAQQAMIKAYREGMLGLPKDAQQEEYWRQESQHKYF